MQRPNPTKAIDPAPKRAHPGTRSPRNRLAISSPSTGLEVTLNGYLLPSDATEVVATPAGKVYRVEIDDRDIFLLPSRELRALRNIDPADSEFIPIKGDPVTYRQQSPGSVEAAFAPRLRHQIIDSVNPSLDDSSFFVAAEVATLRANMAESEVATLRANMAEAKAAKRPSIFKRFFGGLWGLFLLSALIVGFMGLLFAPLLINRLVGWPLSDDWAVSVWCAWVWFLFGAQLFWVDHKKKKRDREYQRGGLEKARV